MDEGSADTEVQAGLARAARGSGARFCPPVTACPACGVNMPPGGREGDSRALTPACEGRMSRAQDRLALDAVFSGQNREADGCWRAGGPGKETRAHAH